ncbi:hypothetical protein PRZ48_000217 [Zasmidium cellare]|uniref:FAD dependent oxidoreductase domain-containing protein n=1 Tax=Zasmidium cellare TaxID=395010 RepID=A0ABR0EZ40_ZASCE|nr:hypothetical protein PRZ48_000217 [Zasmidium cellare]
MSSYSFKNIMSGNTMSENNLDTTMTDATMATAQNLNDIDPNTMTMPSAMASTSSTVQRLTVNKDFTKDTKCKTAKCKVCGDRIKNFSFQCGSCKQRICSECSEADGANTDAHKAVARDFLDQGCWCGFAGKFNTAFSGRMPGVKMRVEPQVKVKAGSAGTRKRGKAKKEVATAEAETAAAGDESGAKAGSGASAGGKRKRGKAQNQATTTPAPEVSTGGDSPQDPFKIRTPTAATSGTFYYVQPDGTSIDSNPPDSRSTNDADVDTSSSLIDPFTTRTPAAAPNTEFFYVDRPTDSTNLEDSKSTDDADIETSSPAEEAQEPPAKRRKSNDSTPKTPEDAAQEPAPSRHISGNSTSSLSSVPAELVDPMQLDDSPLSQRSSTSGENIVVAGPQTSSSPLPPPAPAQAQNNRPRRSTRAPRVEPTPTARKPRQKAPKVIPPTVLEDHIVIVGAGAIGMFTALQLAQKAASRGKQQKITIVDINSEAFALASGHGAGFLTTHGMKRSCDQLMTAAINEWNDLSDSYEFREAVKLSTFVYTTTDEEARAPSPALPWFRPREGHHTAADGASLGLLSTASLSAWLLRQCQQHGVEFRFDHHPTEIKRDRAGAVVGVHIKHADGTKRPELLACAHLLLAAGAFTPALFARLFPSAPVQPSSALQLAHWVRFDNLPAPLTKRHGVLLPGGEGDFISLTSHPARRSVILSTAQPIPSSRRLGPHDALANPLSDSAALRKLAGETLVVEGDLTQHRDVFRDACYVSGKPVLGEVGGAGGGAKVWVAYGFGMVGTTVAPGVGKVLAERVFGEESEVSLAAFGGECGVVGGKGKGRAV